VLAIIVLVGSLPVGRAQAAGSYVGQIRASVICNMGYARFNPGFVPAYEGQWVAFRAWVLNEVTGIYEPTDWSYIQAYAYASGAFHDLILASGSIVSIFIEAYFQNPTTGLWEYGGSAYALHWQLETVGEQQTYCQVY